jgi:hypothetical protein
MVLICYGVFLKFPIAFFQRRSPLSSNPILLAASLISILDIRKVFSAILSADESI